MTTRAAPLLVLGIALAGCGPPSPAPEPEATTSALSTAAPAGRPPSPVPAPGATTAALSTAAPVGRRTRVTFLALGPDGPTETTGRLLDPRRPRSECPIGTDESGSSAIDLEPGSYEVLVCAYDERSNAHLRFEVAGQEALAVQVLLEPLVPVTIAMRGADGRPRSGFGVCATPAGGEGDAREGFMRWLPAGPARFQALRPDGTPVATTEAVVGPGPTQVVLVVEGDRARITGTLVDPTGAPVPNRDVELWWQGSPSQPFRIRTGPDGRFEQEDLPPGSYQLEVRLRDERLRARMMVEAREDVTVDVRLALVPTATLRVRVLGAKPEARLAMVVSGTPPVLPWVPPAAEVFISTSRDGWWWLEGLLPGDRVAVKVPDSRQTRARLRIPPGEATIAAGVDAELVLHAVPAP